MEIAMIESYERDVIASDGAVLHSCYRIVVKGNACDVYDMRLIGSDSPVRYHKGYFQPLVEQRYGDIKAGKGDTDILVRIGRVWIGETGEWNAEHNPHHRWYMPINKCLELLGYKC